MNKLFILLLFFSVISSLYLENKVGKCGKGMMAPRFPYGIEIEWFSSINGLKPLIVDSDHFTLVSEGGSAYLSSGKKFLISKIHSYAYIDSLYIKAQAENNELYYFLFSADINKTVKPIALNAPMFEMETGFKIKDLVWVSLDPKKCFANYIDLFRRLFELLALVLSVVVFYRVGIKGAKHLK